MSVAERALQWPQSGGAGPFDHAITVNGYNKASNEILYVDNDRTMKSMSFSDFRRLYEGAIAIRPRPR